MEKQVQIEKGTARILDDSVLPAYKESIKQYNSEEARESLGKFSRSRDELTGSSPLMIIQLVNSGLLPEGTRLATREDLENAISNDDDFLREYYTDFALALRTAGDSYGPNDLLAKRLAKQLKQRGMALKDGKLIPLNALSLIEDKNSAYGLVADLKEGAESSIRELSDYEWDYTRDEGLACAVFYWYRDWYSAGGLLAVSGGLGRVVVVSAEGTQKNSKKVDLMQKIQSALNSRKAFEYQGTIVPVSDKSIRINK